MPDLKKVVPARCALSIWTRPSERNAQAIDGVLHGGWAGATFVKEAWKKAAGKEHLPESTNSVTWLILVVPGTNLGARQAQ